VICHDWWRKKAMPAKKVKLDKATQNYKAATEYLYQHPIFAPLTDYKTSFIRSENNLCPKDGWAVACKDGRIYVHPKRLAEPEEWIYMLAHCLLHYGMGHMKPKSYSKAWNAACDLVVTRFLLDLKLGKPPREQPPFPELPTAVNEEALNRYFEENGIPDHLLNYGTAGRQQDMSEAVIRHYMIKYLPAWERAFAQGLASAVTSAVNVAGGLESALGRQDYKKTQAQRAKEWFINRYPLLGALASAFKIIEDARICQRLQVTIAAVDSESREIYINPAAGLTDEEIRFVMGHELLHVGLRHESRVQGRDPYLWNVACDYVVNGWLHEMQIGCMPPQGLLHDQSLKGLSAETIYDRIVTDMRRYRKLATLRGVGLGDLLGGQKSDWWLRGEGLDLDEFYRNCLAQGLVYHQSGDRGFLPAGLIEEIQALSQPPVPWDVELAQWFDHYFTPIEKVRTYARPSRRQASTPDIPRPCWTLPTEIDPNRTFGVVLDTSGSMERKLLAKALGTIASYAISRDVFFVRLIFCDAAPYDAGYVSPESIAERVQVKGRGGTVLQPGIDLLELAEDFPKNGPVLIITDGFCDRLQVKHEHAYLLPKGCSLPFLTKGSCFYID
jgi:predicted metal-dependent peptidase